MFGKVLTLFLKIESLLGLWSPLKDFPQMDPAHHMLGFKFNHLVSGWMATLLGELSPGLV